MKDLYNNIYAIPVGDEFLRGKSDCYMVYAPLANVFFLALPKEIEAIVSSIERGIENDVTTALRNSVSLKDLGGNDYSYSSISTLYLILNEKCNFNCKYCYSAGGRSKDEMSFEQMKISLDYFLSLERTAPLNRTIMFIGGGEPTLSWNLIKQGTEYAELLASRNGVILNLRLSTNGSILTDEMLDYYKSHRFQVQYSFEVLKDIQDFQRGSYDIVNKNLRRLLSEGIQCTIRSTITIENVDFLEDMVESCHKLYPSIGKLICEPVVDPGYFSSVELVNDYFDRYFKSFKKALQLSHKYGIPISSSNYGSIRQIRERFCYNLLCMTPFGTLTTCPNISSPYEDNYEDVVVGRIKDNCIIFDDKAYARNTIPYIHREEKCKKCWARWNCGGGCPSQRAVYPESIFDTICTHNRHMLKHYLLHELSVKYFKHTGRNMRDDIIKKLSEQ